MSERATPRQRQQALWVALSPGLFVLLWSTGFIGARLGLPYAPPFTFLVLRLVLVIAVLACAAIVARARWPSWSEARHLAIAGVLIHGVYLGGVFAAIKHGVPAAVVALIVGLQPLLTAVGAGPYLGERVTAKQWTGLAIGLAGVVLVVADKLTLDLGYLSGVAFALAALVGITAGTLYQKRHGGGMDLRSGTAVQFISAAVVMLVAAILFEDMDIEWSAEFVFALSWLVVVLSLGAVSLLYLLIRRGAAAKVASLFYLVPPVTAVLAYLLFGDMLSPAAIAGMAVAVAGVALVTRG